MKFLLPLLMSFSLFASHSVAILDYWFGPLESREVDPMAHASLWFKKNPETDAEIEKLFGQDLRQASNGFYQWTESPRERLALIILLDQMARNIHRNSPEAFMHDSLARWLALEAIALKEDHQLLPVERKFLYMPLMHAEDLELQTFCVELFTRLVHEADPGFKRAAEISLEYAIRHRDIIAQFGRFPHRNRVLGRESTNEEIAFLDTPGSSF